MTTLRSVEKSLTRGTFRHAATPDALFDLTRTMSHSPVAGLHPPAPCPRRSRPARGRTSAPRAPRTPHALIETERGAIVPIAPRGQSGAAPIKRPSAVNAATVDAGLPVASNARTDAAVVPVDPSAVATGLLVAPGVREASMIAPVGALLAVRREAERVVVQVVLAVCIGDDEGE